MKNIASILERIAVAVERLADQQQRAMDQNDQARQEAPRRMAEMTAALQKTFGGKINGN